jgi:hypothetical protein
VHKIVQARGANREDPSPGFCASCACLVAKAVTRWLDACGRQPWQDPRLIVGVPAAGASMMPLEELLMSRFT